MSEVGTHRSRAGEKCVWPVGGVPRATIDIRAGTAFGVSWSRGLKNRTIDGQLPVKPTYRTS